MAEGLEIFLPKYVLLMILQRNQAGHWRIQNKSRVPSERPSNKMGKFSRTHQIDVPRKPTEEQTQGVLWLTCSDHVYKEEGGAVVLLDWCLGTQAKDSQVRLQVHRERCAVPSTALTQDQRKGVRKQQEVFLALTDGHDSPALKFYSSSD